MRLSEHDYVYCPLCGKQERDGKTHKVKCCLVGLEVLPHSGPYLSSPIRFDFENDTIKMKTEREKVGFQGPGVRLIFLCEDGHTWERVVANHVEEAIQFSEVLLSNEAAEAEIDRLAQEEDEDDYPDQENPGGEK
jgi:hypothetical protein